MLILQTLHIAMTLLFPILNRYQGKNEQSLDLKSYRYFVYVAATILAIYTIDHLNAETVSLKWKRILNYVKFTILAPVESIFFMIILFTKVSDLRIRFLVGIGAILIFVIAILLAEKVQKYGLKEILFVTVLGPVFFLSANMILYDEIDFQSLIKFGPINFLFLGTLICFGSRKVILEKNEKLKIWSLSNLLGKQDSFRSLFMMILYCYVHAFIETMLEGSMKHLIPVTIFTYWFYKILYTFKHDDFEESYSLMWKTYLIYTIIFIGCAFLL